MDRSEQPQRFCIKFEAETDIRPGDLFFVLLLFVFRVAGRLATSAATSSKLNAVSQASILDYRGSRSLCPCALLEKYRSGIRGEEHLGSCLPLRGKQGKSHGNAVLSTLVREGAASPASHLPNYVPATVRRIRFRTRCPRIPVNTCLLVKCDQTLQEQRKGTRIT